MPKPNRTEAKPIKTNPNRIEIKPNRKKTNWTDTEVLEFYKNKNRLGFKTENFVSKLNSAQL